MPKFSRGQSVLITNRATPLPAVILYPCHQRRGWYWVELEDGEVRRVKGEHLKAAKEKHA